MINKVTLIGNVGKDPESRTYGDNRTVSKFSLATNENYKDKNGEWQTQTEWHDIVYWGQLSERLKKGSLVFIEGKITHRKYETQEGITKYITEVVCNHYKVLDKRESGTSFPSPLPDSHSYETKEEVPTEDTSDNLPF